jgi:hypothetical protein
VALPQLVTQEQFENFVSAATVQRICDDSGEGEASEDAVNSILDYASSMLRGKLGPVTSLDEVDEDLRPEVTRIGLELAQARAAIRHPEVMRIDGMALLRMAKADLAEVRVNKATLGTREQPDPAEHGAGLSTSARRGW